MGRTLNWDHTAIQSANHWLIDNIDWDNMMNVGYDSFFEKEFNCVIHTCESASGVFKYFNHVEFNSEKDLTLFLLKWS